MAFPEGQPKTGCEAVNIKELAKEQGCSVKNLLVLAPQNDPFYAGVADTQRAAGEWLADL